MVPPFDSVAPVIMLCLVLVADKNGLIDGAECESQQRCKLSGGGEKRFL